MINCRILLFCYILCIKENILFDDTTPFILALVVTFAALISIAIWNNINSPPPYKKGPEPEPGPSRSSEILSRFSQFYNNLEVDGDDIYDTAILPDPKQHIIHALYIGFDESESDEDREAIQRGLTAIVTFQELVGENPLKPISSLERDSQSIPTKSLFINEENSESELSEEEKKYVEFCSKRDEELKMHFEHLKIEEKKEDKIDQNSSE